MNGPPRRSLALTRCAADEGTYALSSNSATLHVPLVHADWRFDAAAKQRKPVSQQINSRFVEDVKKATNCDMGCKILVFCSDGRSRTMGACRALDAAGFQCLVGLKGGYNAFTRAYDTKLAPRVTDSTGEGRKSPWREVNGTEALSGNQTTMGLNHAGGAGFAMMDAPDNQLPLRDAVAWLEFPLAGNEEEAAAGQPAEVPPSRTPAGHGRVLRDGSVLFSF